MHIHLEYKSLHGFCHMPVFCSFWNCSTAALEILPELPKVSFTHTEEMKYIQLVKANLCVENHQSSRNGVKLSALLYTIPYVEKVS